MLDAIQNEYGDRLNVVSLDVREARLLAMRYGVESIPTLIFCDGRGREARRDTGQVITIAAIRAALAKLGVKPQQPGTAETGTGGH